MFPGPHAQIYYNEAGEVLGWDNTYYDEPPEPEDYDPVRDYDDDGDPDLDEEDEDC